MYIDQCMVIQLINQTIDKHSLVCSQESRRQGKCCVNCRWRIGSLCSKYSSHHAVRGRPLDTHTSHKCTSLGTPGVQYLDKSVCILPTPTLPQQQRIPLGVLRKKPILLEAVLVCFVFHDSVCWQIQNSFQCISVVKIKIDQFNQQHYTVAT